MGSLTSSVDPVTATIDILQWATRSAPSDLLLAGFGASQAGFGSDLPGLTSETTEYYPGGADPDRIKRDEDVDPSDKQQNQRLSQVSLYVGPATDGETDKFSAAGDALVVNTTAIEIWTSDSTTTHNWLRDLMDLFGEFSADNGTSTPFYEVYPDQGIVDNRPQGFYYGGFNPESLNVRLEEHREIG
jgi:hypothetical protein